VRILHAVTHYDLLTGSGLYVYELARVMAGRGHEVSVLAENVGGELTARTRDCGVEVFHVTAAPNRHIDVIHVHQSDPGMACLKRWPNAAAVATVHSPWPGDAPIVSDRIQMYACVRPEIRTKVIRVDGVPRGRTSVVFNGIDRTRFKPRSNGTSPAPTRDRPLVLFAATMSPMRRPAVVDLLRRSEVEGFDILLVGLGEPDYLGHLPPNARWERREVWDIENHVSWCDQVAGTFVGRTTIEGWMCGKPAWVYDIVPFRGIRSVAVYPPPPPALLDLCDIEYMADVFHTIYAAAIG